VLLQNSTCQHAVITAPADWRTARFARWVRHDSLRCVEASSASTSHGFGTCSMFIRITACSLA